MQTTMLKTSLPATRPLPVCQPRLPQHSRLQVVRANKETSSGKDSYSQIEAPGELLAELQLAESRMKILIHSLLPDSCIAQGIRCIVLGPTAVTGSVP